MNPAYLSPIANHLWQSTLFAGVAGLLTLALRNNRARVRHWVWLAASCKFLIPLSVLIALGGHIEWRAAPEMAPSNLSVVMDEVSQPFTVPAVSLPLVATAPPAASALPAVLWGIWGCGFGGITCAWWVRWRRIRAAVRAGSPVHLEIPIKSMTSPTLLEPGVFGVLRPVLLLPEGIFDRLTPAQLEAIVAHELCHVRQRDNLIAAIHMFVETVFWFHPLVWWIGKRMVEERERACDEEVLRLGSEPRAYAEGILNVCKLYLESPLVCVSGVTGSNLRRRIEQIVTNRITRNLNSGKKLLLAAAAVTAIVLPVAIGVWNAPPSRAQSPAAGQKFEVASIKANNSPVQNSVQFGPETLSLIHLPLANILIQAYGLPTVQMSFGPFERLFSQRYDIVAKAAGRVPRDQMMIMLQTLLADRFHLAVHHEQKLVQGYALLVDKGGPKLQPAAAPDEDADFDKRIDAKARLQTIQFRSATMELLAQTVMEMADMSKLRPGPSPVIVNMTGIAGGYDFTLAWTREEMAADDTDPPEKLPAMIVGLHRLGLTVKSQKVPVDILVVDHIEKPSEN